MMHIDKSMNNQKLILFKNLIIRTLFNSKSNGTVKMSFYHNSGISRNSRDKPSLKNLYPRIIFLALFEIKNNCC